MNAEDARAELDAYERLLADGLTAADPIARLRGALADEACPDWLRAALSGVDEDGVRISALLVAKLRFERLIQGSSFAGEWFERDGRAFTRAFREYVAATPPSEPFPSGESRAFEAWARSAGHSVDPV